jgi:uroporphyrinogen decarboxylase
MARKTISGIKGPTATHLASGKSLRLVDLLVETKTAIVGISTFDDIAAIKQASHGKLSLLGNLNSISMRHWSKATAEREVKNALRLGAPGGGFILSDNHGEIHSSVPETVLDTIAEAARTWGRYPLDWLP